jgi:hypothetical protein
MALRLGNNPLNQVGLEAMTRVDASDSTYVAMSFADKESPMKTTRMLWLAFVLIVLCSVKGHAAVPDGAACKSKADCASGYCYPGPRGQSYCIGRDWNCALPGRRGAVFGEVYYFAGTYNFCRTRGLQSYPVSNKNDFLLTRSNLHLEAKPGGIGVSLSCDEDGNNCTSKPSAVPGGSNAGSTKYTVRPGYVYCNHDMRVLSQNPEHGKDIPRYGIRPIAIDGITVWYVLPSRPFGQGRTWLGLQTFLLSVKQDLVIAYRTSGLCRVP